MSWCPTLKQQTSVSSCFLFHIRDKPSAKVSYISYLPPPVLLFLPLPLLFSHYLPPHSHLLCLPSSAKIRFAFPSEFLVPIVMCCYHRWTVRATPPIPHHSSPDLPAEIIYIKKNLITHACSMTTMFNMGFNAEWQINKIFLFALSNNTWNFFSHLASIDL